MGPSKVIGSTCLDNNGPIQDHWQHLLAKSNGPIQDHWQHLLGKEIMGPFEAIEGIHQKIEQARS
jgi:hypothetical protein